MNCIDEMTDAEKAWEIVKKIDALKNILWELFAEEFTKKQSLNVLVTIDEEPF